MLWIALDFPRLPLDTFALPSAHTEPWAIADRTDVLVCNSPARALGVRDGMRLSAACALSPQLNYRLRDETAEAATLATLAAWANQFTPNVSPESPRALLLDIEGSLRLFGGIRPILQALKRGLDDMGYSATMACAPTATAALLLARAGMQKIVNCKRALEAVVAILPLAALDCDARTAQTLQAVGVKHVAELMALPRDGLARRGGRQLLDTIDRALGRLPAPRQFFTPPVQFNAKLELAAPVAHSEALLFAARRLLNQLTGFLAARNGGIQRFTLTLRHERSEATRVEIGLVAPTRDHAHLTLLVRERLAALALNEPVHTLGVEADDILVLAEANRELFADRAGTQGEWQKLVERLRARLGPQAVHGVAADAEHRPERASRIIQPGAASVAPACGPRPLWLLAAPQPLREVAARPHYRETALALVAGPERIESGWWDDDDVKRDYFVAQTPDHSTLWIYRERRAPGGWYLHGVFS
jgi:protein ImuB